MAPARAVTVTSSLLPAMTSVKSCVARPSAPALSGWLFAS
jgi:hypothetical protein